MSLNLQVSSENFIIRPFEYNFLQHRNMSVLPNKPVLGQLESFNPFTTPAQNTDFAREFHCCPAIYLKSLNKWILHFKYCKEFITHEIKQESTHRTNKPWQRDAFFFRIYFKFRNNVACVLEKLHEHDGVVKIMYNF